MFEKIKAIIVEELGISASKVTMDAKLIEDLGADSLDAVNLIMALEDEYGVEISDEDARKLVTVGDIVNYAEKISK